MVELNVSPLDGGVPKTLKWQSKVFEALRPLNYSCLQIEAKGYPVLVSVFADEERVFYAQVQDATAVRLPGGFKAKSWEIHIESRHVVYRVSMYEAMMELATI